MRDSLGVIGELNLKAIQFCVGTDDLRRLREEFFDYFSILCPSRRVAILSRILIGSHSLPPVVTITISLIYLTVNFWVLTLTSSKLYH